MDDQYIGKRCPACGLYLAECVLCTPAEVEAATRRKLAGPPVPATPSLEAIRRAASDDSWIPARMALPLVAEVERLRGAVHESLAYDPYGMAGGAQIPLRALNVG